MIYLDNSATTPICIAAKNAIIKHLDDYGNPSSLYSIGQESRKIIENSREIIANLINAYPNEIYFTSGGSEANTWISTCKQKLSSNIEHKSNLSVAVPKSFKVNSNGIVDMDDFKESIKTFMYYMNPLCVVSCMYVNNEIGTIQPIQEMAEICHRNHLDFHTDAVQAISHMKINVKELNCDFLSASGHKFGTPKGVGFLFAKNNNNLYNLINGGKQEQSKRPGTENVLGIAAMAAALQQTYNFFEQNSSYVKELRDYMARELLQNISGSHLNVSLNNCIDSIISIRFDDVEGSTLVTTCDIYGLCISAGSACSEGVKTPSYVLKAIGLSDKEALETIRISIGTQNTKEEIDQAIIIIKNSVQTIRHYKK